MFTYTGSELDNMSLANNYNNWIIHPFLPYIKGTVFEIGAGKGTLTLLLCQNVEHYWAIEPDDNNFIQLKNVCDKIGANCFNGFSSELNLTSDSVNTFIYINVLEHINNDLKELKWAKNKLMKGGTICIFVPALSFLYGEMDKQVGHYRRYSKKNLRDLIEELDFDILSLHYVDSVGVLPWYVSTCLLKNNTVSSVGIILYDRLIVPILRVVEALCHPFVGKNLMLIARKKL